MTLTYMEGMPAERQECPACGALFQWDEATGIITHFYKEGEGKGTDLVAMSADEGGAVAETTGSQRSPEEVIADVREKLRQQAREGQSARPVIFRSTIIIVTELLWVSFVVKVFSDKQPVRSELLFMAIIIALLGGLLMAFIAMIIIWGFEGMYESYLWERYRRRDAPDMDEIAARAKRDNVVRRPLPSDSSSESAGREGSPESAISATNRRHATQNTPPSGEGITKEITTALDTSIAPGDSAGTGNHPCTPRRNPGPSNR
jgi:hypothetical protein